MSGPAWVYDLITAVELYENVHGPHDEHWPCLGAVLDAVPERERDCARAIVTWRQESGWLPPNAQAVNPLRDVDARVVDNAVGLLKSQRREGEPVEIYNAICLLVTHFGSRIEAVDAALEAHGVEMGD